jgi:hypothetical protein
MHPPEHIISGAAHVVAHAPPAHTSPVAHGIAQPPQLAGSVIVSVQSAPHRV